MTKNNKRYFWLRLKNTYFSQLEQKKMRRQEQGKEMQIIYLRMMLLSIDNGGFIYYQGVFDTLEEELAEEFDEPLELIQKTVSFLIANRMISIDEQTSNCFIQEAVECTGSECESAPRVRKSREKKKTLQCNNDVTESNTEIEKEIDKEIYNKKSSPRFTPPTADEVKAYCQEKGYKVNPEQFVDFYESKGWMVGKNKMKDWKAAVRTWAKRDKAQQVPAKNKFNNFNQRQYDYNDLERQLLE